MSISTSAVFAFFGDKNTDWSLCDLPADGHGDDNWLPARVEELSGGRDPPGY